MERRPALTNEPMKPVRISEASSTAPAPEVATDPKQQTIPGSIYWFDRFFTLISSSTNHDHLQQEVRKLQIEFRGEYPGYFPVSAAPDK